jgi:hypothetical protein
MKKEFTPGRYLHYKGNYYIALDTVKHSETEEVLVLYKPENNDQLWVRPLTMFLEEIEIEGERRPRFLYISSR